MYAVAVSVAQPFFAEARPGRTVFHLLRYRVKDSLVGTLNAGADPGGGPGGRTPLFVDM